MPEPDQYSLNTSLTPDQHRVLSLLAEGKSIHAAAEEVGVHRNTVRNWRRSVPAFAREAEFAIREQGIAWHETALLMAPRAKAVLHDLLNHPDTAPSLRARIALSLLKMAADPNPKLMPIDTAFETVVPLIQERRPALVHQEISETRTIMHNRTPIRRPVDPGRNSPCPCGSGQKYKRCCASYAPPLPAQNARAA